MSKYGIALLSFALLAGAARAEDYPSPTDERVRLSIGAVDLSTTTNLRLDSSAGVQGTPVNAEDEFGLASSNVEAKFQLMVRAGERHRLRFDYFSLDRTGNSTLTDANAPISFRDVVLIPTDPVETTLSMRSFGLTYEYSFIHRERFELAATIGINDTDISARARVTTAFRHVDQQKDEAGPFPTIGFDTTYVISKRFYLDARAQYFKLAVDHLTGTLEFYEFDALYRLRPNIAFALGYTGAKADLESRKSGDGGVFDFTSKGPEFFVRVAF